MQELNGRLAQLARQKRRWTPTKPTAVPVAPEALPTLHRALALRVLELPVGEFVQAATRRELPVNATGRALLQSNIQDERVHDGALEALARAYELPHLPEAARFRAWAVELAAQTHPLVVARTLELGVFFVILPLLRFLGSVPMQVVSADISGDERVHVATNTLLCQALKLETGRPVDRFRREVVAWLVEPLRQSQPHLPENKRHLGDADWWLRQSDQLMQQGRAPELACTRRTTVLAFFEIDRRNQPLYAD